MIRLSRRRGLSAQAASSPRVARSTSVWNPERIRSSCCCMSGELDANQRLARRCSVCPSAGSSFCARGPVKDLPNQNSRTRSASSIRLLRSGFVGLEQPLQLRGGGTGGRQVFVLVVLHGVLSLKRRLIDLPEFTDQRFGVGMTLP